MARLGKGARKVRTPSKRADSTDATVSENSIDGTAGSARARFLGIEWPWWLAGAAAVVASLLTFDPKLYINGDNIDYMELAERVRHGELWGSQKFPPGFPWLLAPVQWIAGMRLLPQKLLVFACFAAAVPFVLRIVRRRFSGRFDGPVVAALALTVIPVIEFSHYVMSEIPFFLFFAMALDRADLLLGRTGRTPGNGHPIRGVVGLALACAAMFYIRSAGLAAVAGILGVLLWRRPKVGLVAGALFVLTCVPWMVRSLAAEGGNSYLSQFLTINPYYPDAGQLDLGSFLTRLRLNTQAYFLDLVPEILLPVRFESTYSVTRSVVPLPWPIAAMLLLPLSAGIARGMRDGDVVAFAVLGSLGLALTWPPIWTSARFLVPVAPFLVVLWWRGWFWETDRLRTPVWAAVRVWLLISLSVLALINLGRYQAQTRQYPLTWKNYFAALEWIRDTLPDDVRIVDRKPGFVRFITGRACQAFSRTTDSEVLLREFSESGVTHVVLSSLPYDDIQRYLVPAVNAQKDHFVVRHKLLDWDPDPRTNANTYVLEFLPTAVLP